MWMHTLFNCSTRQYSTLIDLDNPFEIMKGLNKKEIKDIGLSTIEYPDPQWVVIYSYELSEKDVEIYNYMIERG